MLNTNDFGELMREWGFTFFSGVPCSFLSDLINYAINECEYIGAANEGDAVAIASGAVLGGRKAVVLMQNSGLTNATSPLTSLNYTFKLPVLGFVSLRGEPGAGDEPQHELMGVITTQLLDLMQVKWEYLSPDISEAANQLERANQYIEHNQTFFFVVRQGTLSKVELKPQIQEVHLNRSLTVKTGDNEYPTRFSALEVINSLKNESTVQLITTGKSGRELHDLEDSRHNLYMVGSMGCISSLGLGFACAKIDNKVVVIDGDGSLLMRMGSLATVGYRQPNNLLHILLDNHTHDSTGGQTTVSHNIDFVQIAASCGYANAIHCHNLSELRDAIVEWQERQSLTFLRLPIAGGSIKALGRPKLKPHEVKERLVSFIHE